MPDPKFSLDDEVRELFERKLREFAAFLATEWTMTEEQWRQDGLDQGHSREYLDGYNAALTDCVEVALNYWMDEVYQ